jgi:hypothetical protein
MSDVISVAKDIEKKIMALEKGRESPLKDAARCKADTIGNYSKAVAIAIMKLKSGKPAQLEGETIKDPPATIMKDIAKGLCYQEEIDMELADAEYKRVVEKLECLRAELNGHQSIYRHLTER